MAYNPGQFGNGIAIADYPMLTMPTAAMRTYAFAAPPGNAGQDISGGVERGSGFVCARVGRKRSLALISTSVNQRGFHFT